MKKILLADDHQLIRTGLKLLLESELGEITFGEAENANGVFKKMKESEWDLLILDVNMPGRSGMDVLKQLKDTKNTTPVLVLSLHSEEHLGVRALKSGACGYISKDAIGTELIKAVNTVMNGKKYITAYIAEQLIEQINNPADKEPHELLSDREFQTLMYIATGQKISIIAQALSLSVATISTYRARIMEKMGMKTNADLINYSIHRGLI